MTVFAQVFTVVIGHEGGFTANPSDPGNWTGGKCGAGICRGTNWGISAAAYPDLDIQHLSQEDAAGIYQRDFWVPICGDELPPPLALLVFDAAVNNGLGRAARWLQALLGVSQDGIIGPATLTALATRSGDGASLCAEYLAQRLTFMAALPTWKTFGNGWARRLCALPFQALSIAAG